MIKRKNLSLRIKKLHEKDDDFDLQNTTPSERIGMMWQIALDAWAFKGDQIAESGLSRHIISIQRGKS